MADVTGQRADVGALATDHADAHLHRPGVEGRQFYLVDADGLGRQAHILTATGQFVGPVTRHHTGGEERRLLHDIALELCQFLYDQFPCDMGRGIGLIHWVLHVVTGRGGPQLQGSRVFLRMELQTLYLLRRLPCAEDEDARGQGVERTRMSHLDTLHADAFGNDIADVRQCPETRHPVRLVDVDIRALLEVHRAS